MTLAVGTAAPQAKPKVSLSDAQTLAGENLKNPDGKNYQALVNTDSAKILKGARVSANGG
jgi:hypothetical protein